MHRAGAALVAVTMLTSGAAAREAAHAPEASPLLAAQRATRELRYEEAGSEIEAALKRGHHSHKDLVALQGLRAEVAAIVDGAAAGESAFRRVLVLAPEHTPSRNTPIFAVPFAHAQRWVAAHGHLEVEHKIAAAPRAGVPTPLALVVANDPFAMVASARLWVRLPDDAGFVAMAGATLRPSLPPIPAGGAADYYIEVLDDNDSVVAQVGTAQEPFTLEGPAGRPPSVSSSGASPAASPPPSPSPPRVAPRAPEPSPPSSAPSVGAPSLVASVPPPRHAYHPVRVGGGIMLGLGVGALAAAIGVDVTGRQKLDSLQSTCAPSCSQSQVDALKLSERAAIGLYTGAGVTLATALVLFTVDLARSRHHQ